LVGYRLPIEPVIAELQEFGWDAEKPLFTITRQHVMGILSRYLDRQLTAEQVTHWAELVECRDDLGYEHGFEDQLKRTVFELANPHLTVTVTPEVAYALQDRLS
jgi:hypothetical protein